jgi:glyoxylase-like metal-dependent hydrolase (beta-lactamase superfamily II)
MNGGQWIIGDVTVTRIVELELPRGLDFLLPQATPEAVKGVDWLRPHFATDDGALIMSIHALVVETPDRRIMVDTCLGNDKPRGFKDWSHLQTDFLENLKEEGFHPDTFDTVLCTHMHLDHVGWNTMRVGEKWVPTFGNARYLFARTEYEFQMKDHGEDHQQILSDSIIPVYEAGLVDLVETDCQVCSEVRLIPTHGHTPGHVSIMIESKGERGLITGDFTHHPIQFHHPDWASAVDIDPAESTRSRLNIFETYGDTSTLIIGTHFPSPTVGHLKKKGAVWWLDVE